MIFHIQEEKKKTISPVFILYHKNQVHQQTPHLNIEQRAKRGNERVRESNRHGIETDVKGKREEKKRIKCVYKAYYVCTSKYTWNQSTSFSITMMCHTLSVFVLISYIGYGRKPKKMPHAESALHLNSYRETLNWRYRRNRNNNNNNTSW